MKYRNCLTVIIVLTLLKFSAHADLLQVPSIDGENVYIGRRADIAIAPHKYAFWFQHEFIDVKVETAYSTGVGMEYEGKKIPWYLEPVYVNFAIRGGGRVWRNIWVKGGLEIFTDPMNITFTGAGGWVEEKYTVNIFFKASVPPFYRANDGQIPLLFMRYIAKYQIGLYGT